MKKRSLNKDRLSSIVKYRIFFENYNKDVTGFIMRYSYISKFHSSENNHDYLKGGIYHYLKS